MSGVRRVELEQLRDLGRQITTVINPELLETMETERTSS
jgi:hypothetical protein